MADVAARRQALQTALEQTQGQPPEAQAHAVAAALSFEPGTPRGRDIVWIILIGALALALLGSLAGLVFEGGDALQTAFTALLTGIIGLFAPSPTGGGGGGDA